jgi:hypothetical protein
MLLGVAKTVWMTPVQTPTSIIFPIPYFSNIRRSGNIIANAKMDISGSNNIILRVCFIRLLASHAQLSLISKIYQIVANVKLDTPT